MFVDVVIVLHYKLYIYLTLSTYLPFIYLFMAALGIASASLECAAKYAQQRKSFNQAISSLYAIQSKLADMSVQIDAARLLNYKAGMFISLFT